MANINSGFVGKNADSLIENLRLTVKDSGKTEAEVINKAHIQNVAFFIGKRTRPEDICSQHMSAPFDEIAAYHLAAVTKLLIKMNLYHFEKILKKLQFCA